MPTNKELLEKNKTLREENKKLKEEVKNYKDTLDEHFYHYEKLQKENEKLKEKNNRFDKVIDSWVDFWEDKDSYVDGEYELSRETMEDPDIDPLYLNKHYEGHIAILDDLRHQLDIENEKLQKENHENGSIIEKLDNCIADLRDENKQISLATSQVKEQKLSKELTDKITARVKEAIDKERTKSEKLKKELHKLKSDIKEGDLPELKDLNSRWAKKRDENGDSFRRMIKEYKEEINKLKKEYYLYKDKPQLGRSYANSLRENKELQEENKKLKEEREDASYQLAGELEDINTRWAEDKEADRIVIDGLKEQIEN